MYKKIIYSVVGLFLGLGITVYAATVLRGPQGGTGITTVVTGDLIYASGSFSPSVPGGGTLGRLAAGSSGAILQVSGGLPAWSLDILGARTASLSQNLEVAGYASASFYKGSAFSSISTNCTGTTFLQWTTAGAFSCGTPSGGGTSFNGLGFNVIGGTFVKVTSISFDPGGFDVSNTASRGFVFIDYTNGPASRSIAQTITGLWDFNATPTSFRTKANVGIGLNNTPMSALEVWGTASASNLVTLGAVQFANAGATVSYSRFGTSATSHANYISAANDLLISGDIDLVASANFRGFASISSALFTNPTNNRVGIGTLASTSRLTVKATGVGEDALRIASASGFTLFQIKSNGNVGIGTSTPAAALELTPNIGFGANNNAFRVNNSAGTAIFQVSNNTNISFQGANALNANTTFTLNGNAGSGTNVYGITLENNGALANTSGIGGLVRLGLPTNATQFIPTSGTARFSSIENSELIGQTGTSQGTTRGFYENPTLAGVPSQGSGVYDFRDFEIASHTYRLHGNEVAQGLPTTLQSVLFNPVSYSSSSVNTITNAYGLNIPSAPIASGSTTITNSVALRINGGAVTTAGGAVTTAFGLLVKAPTGGSTNIGASISGKVFLNSITAANTTDFVCYNTGTGEIDNSSASCTVSSRRFKTDIEYLKIHKGILDEVLAFKPVQFRYKPGYNDSGAKVHVGVIAEDAYTVDPRLVNLDDQGLPISFDYQNFTAVLAGAIQELNAKVDHLPQTTSQPPVNAPRTHDYGLLGLLGLFGLLPSLRRKKNA